MRVVVIDRPQPIIDADGVRSRLGIGDSDDALNPLIRAVCAEIEPPSWLECAFGRQTLEMRTGWFAEHWGGCELRLRYPPFAEMVGVKYVDGNGVEQTLDPSGYEVVGGGADFARLVLPYGRSWPATRLGPESVRIRYKAGYAPDDPQLEPAKHAVALAVKRLRALATEDLFIRSETTEGVGAESRVVTDAALKLISDAVDGILQRYRAYP